MKRTSLFLSMIVALGLGFLMACGSMLAPTASLQPTHPQALDPGRPSCTECHGDEKLPDGSAPYGAFDHTPTFVSQHRFAANMNSAACATCHSQSFCSDCHSGKTMMAPSTKLADRPDREMPHRAGYLTRHRIDAKADPTGCYKCHGRANNDTCKACHR